MDTRIPKGRGSGRTTCATCGWPLRRSPSQIKQRNFCDYDCRNRHPEFAKNRKPRFDIGTRKSPHVDVPCETCGKLVSRRVSDTRAHIYCSRDCFHHSGRNRLGRGRPAESPIGRLRAGPQGYWWIFVGRNDAVVPRPYHGGWFPAHRYAMASFLGRPLTAHENVHHKNGDRADNRIENLELWVKTQPCGQRPLDLLAWARQIIDSYGPEEERLRALDD